jgi:hypothetical protein
MLTVHEAAKPTKSLTVNWTLVFLLTIWLMWNPAGTVSRDAIPVLSVEVGNAKFTLPSNLTVGFVGQVIFGFSLSESEVSSNRII